MFSLKLIAFLLAVIGLGSATVDNDVIKINPAGGAGDYRLQVVRNGSVTTIVYQNNEGESVSQIFAEEGYEASKPAGSDECHLKRLNETQPDDPSQICYIKFPVTVNQVPARVAEFCQDSTLYTVEPVACDMGTGRRKRDLCILTVTEVYCWDCGAYICCEKRVVKYLVRC